MPPLSRWMVRAALLHFAGGALLGALLLAGKAVPLDPRLVRPLDVHIECVLIGWIVQFALGVAYWILPRLDGAGRRGRERSAVLAFALLNLGVLLVGAGAVGRPRLEALIAAGRMAELAAAGAFIFHALPRVRSAMAALGAAAGRAA